MRTIGKRSIGFDVGSSFILPPSSFVIHAASQETSRLRQFQLALRRAGEAKDDQTKYSQEYS